MRRGSLLACGVVCFVSSLVATVADLTFYPSVCTGQEEENGERVFDEESCGDAQDLFSPDEEDEPPLSNSRGFTGKFSNFEAIIEIASLRVCARVRIRIKKSVDIQTAKSQNTLSFYMS